MLGYYIIKKASIAVLSICSEQEYEQNQEYRVSDFVIALKNEEGYLYHSCFTGELIEVTNINLAQPYLVKHWFWVRRDIDEKNKIPHIKHLLRSLGQNFKPGYKTIEIVTTTNCNAQCFYCYEGLFKPTTMNKETAMKAIDFITQKKISNEIHLKWYGGEPLMNMSVIDMITKGLTDNGITINSTMISNGFLFSKNVISKAKELWHLSNVRITLDGTENIYNETKKYKSYSGSAFQKVINNIDSLLDNNISVTIRLNIEEHNIQDVRLLLNILCNKYRGNHQLDFMLRPLNNTDCNKEIESKGDNRNIILNEITLLKQQLFDDGFDVNCGKLSGMTFYTCVADSGRYIIIKPNGELAYCSVDFDRKVFGSIYDKLQKVSYPELGKHIYNKDKICDDCPIYPLCNPSKLCPSCTKPICNKTEKEYNVSDIILTMKKTFRNYKLTNKI